jgi:hypothetical protein
VIPLRRRGPRPDWTAADYDSYEVLAAAGVRRAAARVTRARSPRPVRRAVRAVLRTAWPHSGRHQLATRPHRSPAN